MLQLANPQKENGYTPIANEILDHIVNLTLNGTQWRIIIVVWRYTYGFSRKNHKLSLTYISNATGMNKQQIKREIDTLIEMNILTEISKPSFNSSREVEFNKAYDEWVIPSKLKSKQSANQLTVNEKDYTTVSELEYSTVSELAYQENNNKTNIKTNLYINIFDYYLTLDLVKHNELNDSMKKAIDKALKHHSEEELKVMLDRHKKVVEFTKNSQYPVKKRTLQEFFGQKVKDGVILICEEYTDDGPKWIKYKELIEKGGEHYGATGTDTAKVFKFKSFDKSKLLANNRDDL